MKQWLAKQRRKMKTPSSVKQHEDEFLLTIRIIIPSSHQGLEVAMKLDTGCEVGNLISRHVVTTLGCLDRIQVLDHEVIGRCLNGQVLKAVGIIILQWQWDGLRNSFSSLFYVIDQDLSPWETVLGSKSITQYGILGLGSSVKQGAMLT
ncbi:MAG: hypothetical protein M1818_003755 [Claussenomyces sp. TS43310]|nr:MAG: hypothetical protein M1818_003755 [Claussenomyces sp. TS43310]